MVDFQYQESSLSGGFISYTNSENILTFQWGYKYWKNVMLASIYIHMSDIDIVVKVLLRWSLISIMCSLVYYWHILHPSHNARKIKFEKFESCWNLELQHYLQPLVKCQACLSQPPLIFNWLSIAGFWPDTWNLL